MAAKSPEKKKPAKTMSAAHKAALAQGRRNARAVKQYLEALRSNRPRRGRKRTPESIRRQLAKVESELESADAIQELNLRQRQRDLSAALTALEDTPDLSGLEAEFIKHAKDYAASKGISYGAFRDVGVSAETLRKAGISRSS